MDTKLQSTLKKHLSLSIALSLIIAITIMIHLIGGPTFNGIDGYDFVNGIFPSVVGILQALFGVAAIVIWIILIMKASLINRLTTNSPLLVLFTIFFIPFIISLLSYFTKQKYQDLEIKDDVIKTIAAQRLSNPKSN